MQTFLLVLALFLIVVLIMAVGYASDYHGIGRAIAKYDIPKLEDTMFERSNFDRRRRQKAAEPRYYRGHRVDK